MTEMGVRATHSRGNVYLTWSDGEDQAHAILTPDSAQTLVDNIMVHIAAARKVKQTVVEPKVCGCNAEERIECCSNNRPGCYHDLKSKAVSVFDLLEIPPDYAYGAIQDAARGASKARTQIDLLLGLLIKKQVITSTEANQIRYGYHV
jgi:hypothetical protein